VQVVLQRGSWPVPAVFPWVQRLGRIADDEMERVFNMGIGMVLVVAPHAAEGIMRRLADLGQESWPIGTVRSAATEAPRVVLA
jgi:phosphoribosylaminoimidazole (AIR) synthetase